MEERIYYPLSPSQNGLFLSRKYTVHKAVLNVATSLILHEKLDAKVLEEAIRKGVERWDSFGLRLVKMGKETKQYFGTRACESIIQKDFTGSTTEEMEQFFNRQARKAMGIIECPMARFFIVTTPEGEMGIFSVINHLIMDSWAIGMFYMDVMGIYQAMMNKGPMPKEMKSYESTLNKELEYAASDRYKKDHEFWENEFKQSEPHFTHINGSVLIENYRKKRGKSGVRYCNNFTLRTKASHEVQTIRGEDVERMKAFLVEYNISTMQALFLMGFRMFLSKVNGRQEDVGFYNVVARRGTMEEKLSGGSRVHFYAFRTIMDENMTFLDGVNMLLNKQNSIYKHVDISPMDVIDIEKSILPAKYNEGYRTAALTFQPLTMNLGNGTCAQTKWYSNGAAAQPLYITIMSGDDSGDLKCYYEYFSHHIRQETVIECHNFIHKVMMEGIRNPQMTLGEIYGL